MCVSVNTVYLQCETLGDIPVVGGVRNVCVCLCLGICTVSSAVANGKLVCVGSVVSLCVCRFLSAVVLMVLQV